MSRNHLACRSLSGLILIGAGIIGVQRGGVAVPDPHEPCNPAKDPGPHANRVVYEGRGLEGIDFSFSRADVEGALGRAEGGTEHFLTWDSSGIQVCFWSDRVKDFHFLDNFKGKLHASNIGIGSDLDTVLSSYGDIKEEKVVDSVCSWQLDRVLLIRASPKDADEPAYKLYYYDLGLFFIFDDEEFIVEFGVYPPGSR